MLNVEGYLTTADTLVYLRTTPRTLYRLLAAGKIPAVRMGHQWRFRRTDLDRWIEQRSGSRSPEADTASAATSLARACRVLVVDDEPLVLKMLTRMLAATDYDVDVASDGLAAIARLRATPFDLLITDLRMVGVGGIELAREAKRLSRKIKVIIITAYPSQSSAIDAVNIGVDGYITKPFHPMDVLAAMTRVLEPESALAASARTAPDQETPDAR